MKHLKYLALLSTFTLLSSLCALAGDYTKRSIDLYDAVQVGNTQLRAGNYKVEWQGDGPAVQVNFLRNGKNVATAPATLQMNDKDVNQDDVVIDKISANTKALKEIDFSHQKEALVFAQSAR